MWRQTRFSCSTNGGIVGSAHRQAECPLSVDAVEKVRSTHSGRNNQIKIGNTLN
jgi:hypothetical protein